MALPGTPGQRISDLCNGYHITQKELAEKIGVSASQLSRIVSGETKTVSSDILMGVADVFKVSTDYILGLSTVSVRKSYDISELGLSEGAVKALVLQKADITTLNRLLEHKNFPQMVNLIRDYFDDSRLPGTLAWNEVISMATASMEEFRQENPEHSTEIKQDMKELNIRKLKNYEAEIERIKSIFISILKDIKKDIDNGTAPTETVTKDILREIQEQLAAATSKKPTKDDVAAAVAMVVSKRTGLGGDNVNMVQKLMKRILDNTEGRTSQG